MISFPAMMGGRMDDRVSQLQADIKELMSLADDCLYLQGENELSTT